MRRPPHKIVALGISHVPEGRAILKRMTVIDNLRMGAYVRRDSEIAERYRGGPRALSRAVGTARCRSPATLSGGEQQMLAIGRALVARPQPAAVRRAFARSCAQDRQRRFFSRCASSRTRARRFSWLSRTPARRCASPTTAMSSSADASSTADRGRNCSTCPRCSARISGKARRESTEVSTGSQTGGNDRVGNRNAKAK